MAAHNFPSLKLESFIRVVHARSHSPLLSPPHCSAPLPSSPSLSPAPLPLTLPRSPLLIRPARLSSFAPAPLPLIRPARLSSFLCSLFHSSSSQELSPALTNRFTVVWVPALEDEEELLAILKARLNGECTLEL